MHGVRKNYIKGIIFQTFRFLFGLRLQHYKENASEVNAHKFKRLPSYSVMKTAVQKGNFMKATLKSVDSEFSMISKEY